MDRKSSGVAIGALLVIALIAMVFTPAPMARHDDAIVNTTSSMTSRDPEASRPIILAQGRCFNGRCF